MRQHILRTTGLQPRGWMRLVGLLLAMVSLVASLAGCGAAPTTPPTAVPEPTQASGPIPGGRLVYGLTLTPSGIDPHIDASSELGIPLTSVYDTLVYQTLDGRFVPGLAERWETSSDGLVYTFYLRQDVVFHDGTPFNAQAVKFNLDRISSPETASRKAADMLGPYERTEVIDDYAIEVHFREPYAPFLDSASQVYLGMASPAAVERWGAEYQLHQVGTGSFLFQEYVPGAHLTLVRNPDYAWAPEIYDHSGPAYLEEIEFRFFTDPAVRALALESGEVHIMGELPPQDAARLEGSDDFQLHLASIPGQPLELFLNVAQPPTDDLQVRQALLHAVDRQAIVDTIFWGYSPIAHGPLTASTMGYEPAVEGMYAYDPEQAALLLDQAGWVDTDGDDLRDKDGQALNLQAYLMTWGYLPEVGQMLQAQLLQVGVGLEIQVVAFPAAIEAAAQGMHNLIPMTFSSSDPSILNTTYLANNADQGFNWSKVRNPELDRLLQDATREMDMQRRADLYGQAQILIMEQALVLPIRDYVNINASTASVQGLRYDRRGWFPWLHDVYLAEP